MMKKIFFTVLLLTIVTYAPCQIVDMENLSLPPDSFWNGSDNSGQFVANQIAVFPNSFTDWGGGITSWSGFAYSNKLDTVVQDFSNQYSCFAGQQTSNSTIFGISYNNIDVNTYQPVPNTVSFVHTIKPLTIHITNDTYTALTIKNGSAYSKKFGGSSGNDPDWFKLIIVGYMDSITTDTVEYYLADYRFVNNQQDYIVKNWQTVDLSSLGIINQLSFTLYSSDTGSFGMNTPAYFCFDNLYYENAQSTITVYNETPLMLYPNPAHDVIHFNKSINNIEVFNIIGNKLFTTITSTNTLNIVSLPCGYYFIHATDGNNAYILRFYKAQ